MSKLFKILGLLLVLFGLLDFGLLGYDISLWRVIGIEPWWLIGKYTYLVELIYGGLTIFVADYLKKPPQKEVKIVDLADPYIGADSHYVTLPRQDPPLRIELWGIVKGLIWGGLIAAAFLLIFVAKVPGMEAVLFPDASTNVSPQMRKGLIAGSVLAVILPMIIGVFLFRLRDSLSVTAMIAGWVVTSALLVVAILETPRMGQQIYGTLFMKQVHTALGHPSGLPPEWSVEREVTARLQRAGRIW